MTVTAPEAFQIRALVTAWDATAAFDWRCEVREVLLSRVWRYMPDAIVKHRHEFAGYDQGLP